MLDRDEASRKVKVDVMQQKLDELEACFDFIKNISEISQVEVRGDY